MKKSVLRHIRLAFVAVVAMAAAACAETAPMGPGGTDVPLEPAPRGDQAFRAAELGSCTNLLPPAGSRLSFHTYAKGDQIYRWNGTSWGFVAPSALLYADAGFTGVVGDHYAGPSWRSNSGSLVVGAVLDRCDSPSGSIQWLILRAVSAEGPGIFAGTTRIQRVNTTGGTAPATAGSFIGQEIRVPYTAEYFFYKAK